MKPPEWRLVNLQSVAFSSELVSVDKLKVVAKQRDEDLRAQFALDVIMHTPEMLVFLDKTGSDRCNSLRKYGYSLRGKPTVSKKLLVNGECTSAMAFMSMYGMFTSRWCLKM